VVHDDHVYALDNQGSAGPITNLVCIRLSDGMTMWKQSRFGKSNMILADGRLWISTMKGELILAAASPEGYQEISRCTLIETTRQAPVIADGRLYLRDDQEIVCVKVAGDTP
jgi:outer membrane protein assembly factor BamB